MNRDALSFLLDTIEAQGPGPTSPTSAVTERTLLDAADMADRNGLYHPFVEALLAKGYSLPASHASRWSREQADRVRLRRTLVLLNRIAEQSGARYVVIKDAAIRDAVPRDVDVFVPETMNGAFLAGLASEGLAPVFDNEAEHSFAREDTMRIDVYNRIHYLGRDFLSPEFLWNSRIRKATHGVKHPGLNASASFLVNSIHGLLGHAGVSLLDLLDLAALQAELGDLTTTRSTAIEAGWGRCFDRWVAFLDELEDRVLVTREPIRLPLRHGHRLVRECVAGIDGGFARPGRGGILGLTLLWDDLLFFSEESGLARGLRRSRIVGSVANAAGHRLRIFRGDRKASGWDPSVAGSVRTRTGFR